MDVTVWLFQMSSPAEVVDVVKPITIEFHSNLLSALIVDCKIWTRIRDVFLFLFF